MTASELQAKLDALNNEIAGKQAEALKMANELDAALAKERAAAKVASMSDAERAAMAEALGK